MNEFRASSASVEKGKTFEQTIQDFSASVRRLIPEQNMEYYKKTNEMHCDMEKPGGSKFTEIGNILEVIKKDASRIDNGVDKRKDDREAFLAMGVDEKAFLPATKTSEQPSGLPEALYFKVDGIKGKLGVIQLKDLLQYRNSPVIVRREKSVINEQTGKEKVPCSFSIIRESMDKLPDVDFATVIIGREGGEEGKNELWTVHPGAPIKPAEGDFIKGSESLPGPIEGEKQKVIRMTVGELLATGKMTENDYVKITIGDFSSIMNQYEVLESQEKIKPLHAKVFHLDGRMTSSNYERLLKDFPGYVKYNPDIHDIRETETESKLVHQMPDFAMTIVKEK